MWGKQGKQGKKGAPFKWSGESAMPDAIGSHAFRAEPEGLLFELGLCVPWFAVPSPPRNKGPMDKFIKKGQDPKPRPLCDALRGQWTLRARPCCCHPSSRSGPLPRPRLDRCCVVRPANQFLADRRCAYYKYGWDVRPPPPAERAGRRTGGG